MDKTESNDTKNIKTENFAKKLNNTSKEKNKRDKNLPWWVEILFVQIGLPDKFLIKILKTNKNLKKLFKDEKKLLFTSLLFITSFAYLYPVVKQSKNELECVKAANNYIIRNKNLININKEELKMLSTNFCNGGEEINKITKN